MYLIGIADGGRRGTGLEADAAARADAAVRDGVAELQVAGVCGWSRGACWSGLGFHPPGRHADPGRVDRRLGRLVLSARCRERSKRPTAGSKPTSRPSWKPPGLDAPSGARHSKPRLAEIDHQIAADYQRQSILGRFGQWIEPAVRPLGWDWRIGCAVIASFPAREVVIGALGVIYNLGRISTWRAESDQNRLIEPIAGCPARRHRRAGLQRAGGIVDDGVFRTLCAVRLDPGGDPARDQELVLAAVYIRLHDDAGLRRRAVDLSNRPLADHLKHEHHLARSHRPGHRRCRGRLSRPHGLSDAVWRQGELRRMWDMPGGRQQDAPLVSLDLSGKTPAAESGKTPRSAAHRPGKRCAIQGATTCSVGRNSTGAGRVQIESLHA